ncbi:hypothetical protein GCM10023088_67440 [Actinomadura verrucosospora]|uniref:ATP-binding protein n=1 Tax=Actinomadura verrucosospora TaxID=46165 RepID=UPI0031EC5AB9
MEITMDLVLPRDVASVPATRKLLDAALAALGVEGHIRDDIEMMLTEACTNVIKHAEHGADYTVRAMIQDRRCVIKVIDSGTGFDAARVPAPDPAAEQGRGLMIMRALADDVRFASFPEDGALVALEKRLSYSEDSLGGLLTADSETPDGFRPGSGELAARLFEMARVGDTQGILSYVNDGVPVNLSDHRGETLLMHAACHGHVETVRALTLRGADPDRADDRGHRPLTGAVFKRETEVVRVLLEAGADPRAGSPSAADTARLVGDTELLSWFEETAPPPA